MLDSPPNENAGPMRLAVVTASVSKLAGGLFNSVRKSAITLSAQGNSVAVYSLEDEQTAADLGEWAPLMPTVKRRKGLAPFGFYPNLQADLSKFDANVVHQHGIWEGMSRDIMAWCKKHDRPVMISPRGMLDPWALANSRWRKKLVGALWTNANLRGAACLHALNESEAQSMRTYGLQNPIAVIPNGTDLPDDHHVASLEKPDWCSDDRKILLFIGRIHPKKGVDELIAAWAKLKHAQPKLAAEWRVVIAGWDDGGHVARLRKSIDETGLADDVLLPGSLFGDEKAVALAHADAFILPSYSEGMPMSILEAWAYRLPVLMTDACNLPEGFERGSAFRITPDVDQLARELAEGLSEEVLAPLGEAGRALVEERFEWSGIAQRHSDVYRWMISGGAAPADVML